MLRVENGKKRIFFSVILLEWMLLHHFWCPQLSFPLNPWDSERRKFLMSVLPSLWLRDTIAFSLAKVKMGLKFIQYKFSKGSFEIIFIESLSISSRIFQLFVALHMEIRQHAASFQGSTLRCLPYNCSLSSRPLFLLFHYLTMELYLKIWVRAPAYSFVSVTW